MNTRLTRTLTISLTAALLLTSPALAADWPTYRHDAARSGHTEEALSPPLALEWVHQPRHAPEPAWPMPAKERARVRFDDAFHVAAVGDTVYFASTADNKVYALDAATGHVRWAAFTNGPIRCAPTVADGRVYVGSDDGFAYCFNASDGSPIWQVRAARRPERIVGNGKMISLWPVRTGVLVEDGIAYFGAGVFPHESLFLKAVDATTGKELWCNDSYGEEGSKLEYGGMSPQGYLLASAENLFVPSARAMPAGFNKATGDFRYFTSPGGKVGGTWSMVVGDRVIAGQDEKRSYKGKDGYRGDAGPFNWFPALQVVATEEWSYMTTHDEVAALDQRAFKLAEQWHNTVAADHHKTQRELWAFMRDQRLRNEDPESDEAQAALKKATELDSKVKLLESQKLHMEQAMYRWRRPGDARHALVLAGDTLYLGGKGYVAAADSVTGTETWRVAVDGIAAGIAVANGRLLVSTDTGAIYAFSANAPASPKTVTPATDDSPYPEDALTPLYAEAADRIVSGSGVTQGFCFVYGNGQGRLAYEIAQRTDLKVVGADPVLEDTLAARAALDAAGLLGTRVVCDHGDLTPLPYGQYFADLVVSDRLAFSELTGASVFEAARMLRPNGGVAYLGMPDGAPGSASTLTAAALATRLGKDFTVTDEPDAWVKIVRQPLEGAGEWTHLYADASNTSCSQDEYIKGPLGVLWFGGPGPEQMVDRHARVSAPVSKDGRFFVQGEDVVMAYGAYNGLKLWQREFKGSTRVRVDSDTNNLILGDDGVYVAVRDRCERLDPATGETIRTFKAPPAEDNRPLRWGYVATVGNTLFGSTAPAFKRDYGAKWKEYITDDGKEWRDPDKLPDLLKGYEKPETRAYWSFQQHGYMWNSMGEKGWPNWGSVPSPQGAVTDRIIASDRVFAADIETGETRWVYEGGLVPHPAIAVGDGLLFLTDCGVTDEQKQAAMSEKESLIAKGVWERGEDVESKASVADVRRVVAIDIMTGEYRWDRYIDLTGCGGDRLGLAYQDGILLAFGCFSNHDLGLFNDGKLKWRRITAIDAEKGTDIWSKPLNYLRRPVIIDDMILIEPRACDLRTGEVRMRPHPLTGKLEEWEFVRPGHCCSVTTATPNMFFLRGYHMWYYDMQRDQGMLSFGAIRPGCWVNIIPSNGLVLFPEASSGCTCSYPIRSTVALRPREEERLWSIYIQHGEMTPVKHMAVNFGAQGDWRADDGTLWFGYPHHPGNNFLKYGVPFNLRPKMYDGGGPKAQNFQELTIEGSDQPWLYSARVQGLKHFTLPLLKPDEGPGVYTIRLHFAEMDDVEPGRRVFSVKFDDKTVLRNFDIVKAAGATHTAVVKEITGVKVDTRLKVELVPKADDPGLDQQPLLSAIEVIRTDSP